MNASTTGDSADSLSWRRFASALGMLVAPRSVEYTRSEVCRLERLDWDRVSAIISELDARALELIREAEADTANVSREIVAEMRYIGQGYEVSVHVDDAVLRARDTDALHSAFEAKYRRRFDRTLGDLGAEVLSWRVRVEAPSPVQRVALEPAKADYALTGERNVHFAEFGGFRPVRVYARARLVPGTALRGPAIVEEAESTVAAGPESELEIDKQGNLVMHLR